MRYYVLAVSVAAGLVSATFHAEPTLHSHDTNAPPKVSASAGPPIKVSLNELLEDTHQWNSNRVEVAGYYLAFFEHSVLTASKGQPPSQGIWIDTFRIAPSGRGRISLVSRGRVRVVGTFRVYSGRGAGHLNMCAAEITDLEVLEEIKEQSAQVTLQRLLAEPERWRSNRVEVSGYYVYGMEVSGLFASAADAKNIYPRITNALWINYWDSLPTARTNNIELLGNQYVRIVGTFDFRRLGCGHCNQWPAMITHIESIERIRDPPKTPPGEAARRDSRIKKPLPE